MVPFASEDAKSWVTTRKLPQKVRALPKASNSVAVGTRTYIVRWRSFDDTLELIKSRNETRVVCDIEQLIVSPAEMLRILGAKHLSIWGGLPTPAGISAALALPTRTPKRMVPHDRTRRVTPGQGTFGEGWPTSGQLIVTMVTSFANWRGIRPESKFWRIAGSLPHTDRRS